MVVLPFTYICYLNDIQDSFMNVLDGRLGVDTTAPSGFHLVEEAESKIELPCNLDQSYVYHPSLKGT